ncbi:unnamed protein product [Phaeothamnion confervicola]
MEAFLQARRGNTVMIGDTGVGKTLVSIMLLRDIHQRNPRAAVGTKDVEEKLWSRVRTMTGLKTVSLVGRDLDLVGAAEMQRELLAHEILVMTPGAFLNLLHRGRDYITLDRVLALVFDECHQARKRHPYARIMGFYSRTAAMCGRAPLVFGMTASPMAETETVLKARAFICEADSDDIVQVRCKERGPE